MEKRNTNPPNKKVLKRPKKHGVRDVILNERSLVPIVASEREFLEAFRRRANNALHTSLKAPSASEEDNEQAF